MQKDTSPSVVEAAASRIDTGPSSDEMETWKELRDRIGTDIEAPEDPDIRITVIAVAFHELWLRTRRETPDGALRADGYLEPRVKTTKDISWAEHHQGNNQVDIAGKFFPDLPTDWQAENLAAAEVIDTLLQELGGADHVDLTDNVVRQHCGEVIHDKWLERNSYARGGELDVPFADLPPNEQNKDLIQLEFALTILGRNSHEVHSQPWMTRVWKEMNNWALDRNLPMRAVNGSWINPESFYYRDQVAMRQAGER